MDENTVFNANKPAAPVTPPVAPGPQITKESLYGPSTPQTVAPPPPSSPVAASVGVAPPLRAGGTPPPAPPAVPPMPSGISSFPIGLFAKAGLGLLVVALILFGVFKFVLPMFSTGKSENAELTYWGLWEDPNVMNVLISDFQRTHPSIKVKYIKQDIKQYRERLSTRINDGNGPDIFRYHNTWQPELSSILLPLSNDTMSPKDFGKVFYPVASHDLVKNGALYGIPLEIDTLSLFVNSDILSALGVEAPKTWEEFVSVACQATIKDETGRIKTAGASMGTYDNITHAPDVVSLLLVQNGANLVDLQSTAQNAMDALNFYTRFAQTGACRDTNGNNGGAVWDETLDPSILAFSKGSLAMYFGYSWDILTIKAANPNLPFRVYPVPHLPGRNSTIASYWVEGVSQKSKHQKEAMLFLKYLSQKETEQKLFTEVSKTRSFGEPYARTDLASTLSENNMLKPFVDQAPGAISSYFAADTYDDALNTKLNNYLGNAIRSIHQSTSPESALQTLSQGVAQVLNQYNIR